jgi:hypothetical protein
VVAFCHREQKGRSDSDSMWMYTADDFSEDEELKRTTFGIKFRDADVANGFKKAYESACTATASSGSPAKASAAAAAASDASSAGAAGAGAASGGASASASGPSADAGTRLDDRCIS